MTSARSMSARSALAISRAASRSSARASCQRALASGPRLPRAALRSWRARSRHSRASRVAPSASTWASRVSAASAGWTRAGWPRRTARSWAAASRTPRLSTAVFDGAAHSTRSPRATRCRTTSTSVRVLPVPGGPWISAMSPVRSAASTAARWRSSSAVSSGVQLTAASGRGGLTSAATSRIRARSEVAIAAIARSMARSPRSNVISGASGSSA
jgi:hypothetical protein